MTVATYDNLPFITVDEENCQITCELVKELASYEQEGKTFNAFDLLKESGLSFQGENIVVNEISLVPASSEETVNYYAVGGFQGWNVESPAEFTFADGVYTLVAEKASTMKISTLKGDWDSFNSATIAPAEEEGKFVVKADYEFVLDYEATWTVTINPTNQTINFATEDERPQVDIYVRGGMNGWGAEDAWKLTTTDGVIYTLAGVSIASDVQFKIADASWGTINYGANEAVTPNTVVALLYNGGNISLTESVENATIEFNLTDKTLKVITGNSVNAIESENAAVYYNLQGVKVANPAEGNVYIVKKGSKVSKMAF